MKAIVSWYGSADKEYRHIHPREIGAKAIGHFAFFREPFRGTLWQDARAWLQARTLATAI